MDEDENQRVTDVILDSARHDYDDPLQDDEDGVRTHTSKNETAYRYAETQREVGGVQYRKQIFITNFY